ncbi:SGNH/GDSL hydrolase family protein [Nocardia lijiangensis]|uniref:SGNH/GDSL hydrolase family protein n=1 Tax=Nocardia lijiangensis TaxID=299618 RepID=UPI003D741961
MTTYREYVALGDSHTADVLTGLPPNTESTPVRCDQSPTDYPHQVAAALAIETFRDASCGGARTVDMAGPQTVPFGVNAPQFDRLTATTDLVTIGIGGNDIGLEELLAECVNPKALDPAAVLPPEDSCVAEYTRGGVDRMADNIAAVAPKIAAALAEIGQRSPKARILVVNYLTVAPVDGTGCRPFIPMADIDIVYLRDTLARLNDMLAREAAASNAELVDVYTPSAGHDVCQAPTVRYVEGFVPFSIRNPALIAFPLHPNAAGADFQAEAVLAAIHRG